MAPSSAWGYTEEFWTIPRGFLLNLQRVTSRSFPVGREEGVAVSSSVWINSFFLAYLASPLGGPGACAR